MQEVPTKTGVNTIDIIELLNYGIDGMRGYRAGLLGKDKQDQITQMDLKIELYKIAIHCMKAAAL